MSGGNWLRGDVTAGEWFVLWHGERASGREVLRLGLSELVARRAARIDGDRFVLEVSGRSGISGLGTLRPLLEILEKADPKREGITLKAAVRVLRMQYGLGGTRYVSRVVVPALVRRGWFRQSVERWMWVFPWTRTEITNHGMERRRELEAMFGGEAIPNSTPSTSSEAGSPAGLGLALATVTGLGTAYLLLAEARGLRERMKNNKDDLMELGLEFGGDDFDPFRLTDMGLDSLDAGFESFDSGTSDGGGGGDGGDGGGGGGGDGGGGGGGD